MGYFELQNREKIASPDPVTQRQGLADDLDQVSSGISAWASVQHNSDGTHTFIGQGSDLIPIGAVVTWHSGIAAPTHWLKTDGSLVSRATYATLYKTIGTLYGVGDGVNTFQLPTVANSIILAG